MAPLLAIATSKNTLNAARLVASGYFLRAARSRSSLRGKAGFALSFHVRFDGGRIVRMRFFLRHWTAVLIVLVLAGWTLFYLPYTPSYTIFRLKQAVDARDGETAASYVDFQKVVQNAGHELVQGDAGDSEPNSNLLGQLLGRAAVDLFSGPMAALVRQWSIQQVNDGAREVQMPGVAVAGAILLLRNDGAVAHTRWTDNRGRVWEVRLTREANGWRVTEVKNIRQLLEKLRQREQKEFNPPPEYSSPPKAAPTPGDGDPPRSS